jgi:hypothetical protein
VGRQVTFEVKAADAVVAMPPVHMATCSNSGVDDANAFGIGWAAVGDFRDGFPARFWNATWQSQPVLKSGELEALRRCSMLKKAGCQHDVDALDFEWLECVIIFVQYVDVVLFK